jgi:hypothetical protein
VRRCGVGERSVLNGESEVWCVKDGDGRKDERMCGREGQERRRVREQRGRVVNYSPMLS